MMKVQLPKLWALVAMVTLTLAFAGAARAQEGASSLAGGAASGLSGKAASMMSGDQVTAAKSALCSAIASKFPNPAAAGPSALSDPSVLSTAATSFAGSTHMPLPSATDMIKNYAMEHATDILGSCAASSATSGITSKIPGSGSMPSIPKF